MCLVIDTNTFSSVFNRNSSEHYHYEPVLDWIQHGKGVIIYGGTKYKKELKTANEYRKILTEFKKKGKVIELPTEKVDKYEDYVKKHDCVKKIYPNLKPDDPNIDARLVAIIKESRCRIICTKDIKAKKLIREKPLYPNSFKIPEIYSNKSQEKLLLHDKNIVKICQKNKKDKYGNKREKLNKKDRDAIDRDLSKL
ncbi:MAG: hypothetical protein HQL02_10345 [Nitrospirae bacterium]|nr:hypothetical protein [Nitrospirota bacterium]